MYDPFICIDNSMVFVDVYFDVQMIVEIPVIYMPQLQDER